MNTINRNVMILAPKKAMYDWINKTFPNEIPVPIPFNPLENENCSVYLIPELDSEEDFTSWIKRKFKSFFEEELSAWCSDTDLWPDNLTYNMFADWFQISYQSIVFDSVKAIKCYSE